MLNCVVDGNQLYTILFNMKNKVCFFNQSPIHYRKAIYELMGSELHVDFFFGDSRPGGIKPYDTTNLKNKVTILHNVNIGPFYWQKGALKLLRSEYTDIITPGDINCLSTWLIIVLSKLYKKNVYTWTHGAYGKEGFFRRVAIRFRVKCVKGVFLYGNYAKNVLIKYGVDVSKLYVIYNSLNYDEQVELRKTISISDKYQVHFCNDFKNIIFIGRLTRVKKLDMILSALFLLKKRGVYFNLTYIGDGVERDNLENMANSLELNNVWFYGPCYDEKELAEMIYNADLCVSPGNVGLTAMHSMVFGTPVISHCNFVMQMPEVEAIEDGLTGSFFEENNITALASSIENWFVHNNNNRELIRENCYKVIDEKFNPHVQIEIIKKALKWEQ